MIQEKVRYRRCEYCSAKTDTTKLYKVRGKWACALCGARLIREWNEAVAAVNSETINTVSP